MEWIDDEDILPLCMEHNFWTWSAQAKINPIPVTRAQGVHFWDVSGKKYLDFNSMVMCSNIGHGDKRVIEAIAAQANELAFAGPGMATRARALLGKLLSEVTPPGLDTFLFTLGGADANENAIKLARGYTGKSKILSRYRSYHGATFGAIAATGDPRRTAWEPEVMPGVVHFLDPYRYRSVFHRRRPEASDADICQDYLDHLEEIIQFERPDTIAAILIETITGTNGVIIPPPGYLQGVRKLCDRYGVLLICDEVMSGFGRTGEWFAVDHWGVVPDLMTMAKGLTSGYAPLGAVAMRKEIARAFDRREYVGGLTYNGHPISLAAASAVIQVMKEDNLIQRVKDNGGIFAELMAELIERHPSVGEARCIGLFGAIELVKDRETREPLAPFNGTSPAMVDLRKRLLDQGLFVYTHWHTLLLLPPLIISAEQLREGFEIIDRALSVTDREVNSGRPM